MVGYTVPSYPSPTKVSLLKEPHTLKFVREIVRNSRGRIMFIYKHSDVWHKPKYTEHQL